MERHDATSLLFIIKFLIKFSLKSLFFQSYPSVFNKCSTIQHIYLYPNIEHNI
jgi:hypothetical protein